MQICARGVHLSQESPFAVWKRPIMEIYSMWYTNFMDYIYRSWGGTGHVYIHVYRYVTNVTIVYWIALSGDIFNWKRQLYCCLCEIIYKWEIVAGPIPRKRIRLMDKSLSRSLYEPFKWKSKDLFTSLGYLYILYPMDFIIGRWIIFQNSSKQCFS